MNNMDSLNLMSHEVRTKLGTLLGFIELLREPGLNESDHAHYIEILHRNGKQLLGLINDILDLEKIEKGKFEFEVAPVSLTNLLTDAFSFLQFEAAKRDVSFILKPIPINFPGFIQSDAMRIQQILLGILRTCVNCAFKGDIIVELVRSTEKSIRVQITAFVDLRKPAEGDQLRLQLSRQLAKALGGILEIQRFPAGETNFSLILPKDDPEKQTELLTEQLIGTSQ